MLRGVEGVRAVARPTPRALLLVGGGHAHVQLLRRFAMQPIPSVQLTLVVDRTLAVYSGMLPGFVAGQYLPEELTIDLAPLAARAGARLILARAERLDPYEQRLYLARERAPLRFDAASIDIGSAVREPELAGDAPWVLPTRPIGTFLERFDFQLERLRQFSRPVRVLVVGGGAAGVELAACLRARLDREGIPVGRFALMFSGSRLVEDLPEHFALALERELEKRGISVWKEERVTAVTQGVVLSNAGREFPCDLLLWATGPAAHPFGPKSGLAVDASGFLLARPTLQLEGYDNLFGAGDCISFRAFPNLPKSGVYAVREGPVLAHNLRAWLSGKRLRSYRPQRDFLALLNFGDGTAWGTKRCWVVGGRWVMRLKSWIDRRFMRRFQVDLEREPMKLTAESMACGGCAAKLEASVLEQALCRLPRQEGLRGVQVGLAAQDDVAAIALSEESRLLATVDLFRDFLNDPWLLGRVAALNAVSDLEAKGVSGGWALAIVMLPIEVSSSEAGELLFQLLSGAQATFSRVGVTLVGGHTARGSDLAAGFAVFQTVENQIELRWRKADLRGGEEVWLTRPLGTGVLLRAAAAGFLTGPEREALEEHLLFGNQAAVPAIRWARAATDVTGFGLAGHMVTLLDSAWSAEVSLHSLPVLPGVDRLLRHGLRSVFHQVRWELLEVPEDLERDPRLDLLFDPQTAGPLLLLVPAEGRGQMAEAWKRAGLHTACRIGSIVPRKPGGRAIRVLP